MKSILESNGLTNEIAFYALYGSQNYNADTEKSDFDYVVYVFPNDREMISGQIKEKTYVYDKGLVKVKDVRKIKEVVIKPTISSLELLVSKDSYIDGSMNRIIRKMRQELKGQITMNKKRIIDSSVGMCNNYMKQYARTNDSKYLMRALMFYGITNVSVALADDNKVKFEDCLTVMGTKVMKKKMNHFNSMSHEEKIDFSNDVASKIDFLKRLGKEMKDKKNEGLETALDKRLLKVLKGRL